MTVTIVVNNVLMVLGKINVACVIHLKEEIILAVNVSVILLVISMMMELMNNVYVNLDMLRSQAFVSNVLYQIVTFVVPVMVVAHCKVLVMNMVMVMAFVILMKNALILILILQLIMRQVNLMEMDLLQMWT